MIKVFIKKIDEKITYFEISDADIDGFIKEAINKGYVIKDSTLDGIRVLNLNLPKNLTKSLKEAIELL